MLLLMEMISVFEPASSTTGFGLTPAFAPQAPRRMTLEGPIMVVPVGNDRASIPGGLPLGAKRSVEEMGNGKGSTGSQNSHPGPAGVCETNLSPVGVL